MRWIWLIALFVAAPAFAQGDSYETPAYQPQPTPKYDPAPVVKLDPNYGLPSFGTVDAFVDKQKTQAPLPSQHDVPSFFTSPHDRQSLDGASDGDETSLQSTNDDGTRQDTDAAATDDDAADAAAVKALDQMR